MPYKNKEQRRDYQREFMKTYRKKEREMIRQWKASQGITNGRKKPKK